MWSTLTVADRRKIRRPPCDELKMSISEGTTYVSLVKTFSGLDNSEKEERARRVYFKIQEEAVGEHPTLCCSLQNAARYLYYAHCYKVSNQSVFCYGANLIRKNYGAWKQYTSDPYKGIPTSLKSLARKPQTIIGLALLEKINFISLEPGTQFLIGEAHDQEILFGDVSCAPDIKDILALWDSLFWPRVDFATCTINFIREAFIYCFGHCFRHWFGPSDRVSSRSLDPHCNKILISELLQFLEGDYYLPITHYDDDMFKFDFEKLVNPVSLSIAFDGPEIDTLGAVYELFPNHRELLPQIIRKYRVSNITLPENKTVYDELNTVHSEAFGCKINYDNCVGPQTKLHHRGAVTLIQKHPQLFQSWKDDPEMKFIYKDLVEPALRAQLFSNISLRL